MHNTEIIKTHHPSHCVNYHRADLQKRQELLRSICKVYQALASNKPDNPQKTGYLDEALSRGLTFSNLNAKPTSIADTEWLGDCLNILMTLCFQPRHCLPTIRMEAGSFYILEDWHLRWLERCSEAKAGPIEHARALLIPIFQELNSCFRRVSWFVLVYEMEWTVLSRILQGFTTESEQACYLLASGNEIDRSVGSGNGLNWNKNLVCVRVSRTVLRAKYLWESRPHHPKRTARYIGPIGSL